MDTKRTLRGSEESRQGAAGIFHCSNIMSNPDGSSILGARQAETWFVYHFLTFTGCNGFCICNRVFNPCDTAKSMETPRILFGIDTYL